MSRSEVTRRELKELLASGWTTNGTVVARGVERINLVRKRAPAGKGPVTKLVAVIKPRPAERQ